MKKNQMKRSSLRSSVLTAAVVSVSGCWVGDDVSEPLGATTDELEVAAATMVLSASVPNEHCRVHASRLGSPAAGKWQAGSQLLIYRGAMLRGMCTVNGSAHANPNPDVIEMSSKSLGERVWFEGDGYTAGKVAAVIPNVTVRDHGGLAAWAPALSQVGTVSTLAELELRDDVAREYLHLNDAGAGANVVAYLVPHPWENATGQGGALVGRSFSQWKAIASLQGPHDSNWAPGMLTNYNGQLFDPNTGGNVTHTKRFHITATDISTSSFPRLAELIASDPKYAVAFHGSAMKTDACNQGTMVGGALGTERSDRYAFRRGIAENIRMLVDPSDPVPVQQATPLHGLDPAQVRYSDGACNFDNGIGDNNIVNRVAQYVDPVTTGTVRRGVQFETGAALETVTYQRIGLATREVFECASVDAANVDAALVDSGAPGGVGVSSAATAYTDGPCRGFVVDVTAAASAKAWTGRLVTPVAGGKVHVDLYQRNADQSWDRIGGGTVEYATAVDPPVVAAYDDTADGFAPSFAPGASGDVAGTYRLVVYGYTGAYFTPAAALPVYAGTAP